MQRIKRWICRLFGHDWVILNPYEHICIEDCCWRCWEPRTVHLAGPWPHTCEELKGVLND